jgi:argininosuccinate lyase
LFSIDRWYLVVTQNPLDNIRKRQVASRPVFPNQVYEEQVLSPVRGSQNAALEVAAVRIYLARVIDLAEIRTIEQGDALEAVRSLRGDLPEPAQGQLPLDHIHTALSAVGGGRALLGSSPEEVEVCATRMVLRHRVLDLRGAITSLRSALSRQALGHLTTAITATTNGQMVQPTSLGHYLTSVLPPLRRSTARLDGVYQRLNRSPLGAVSGMGSAVPYRAARQAELLGFDGLEEHSFDALASADVEFELVSVVSGLSIELSRLVADLGEWARDDTGTIVPGEEFVHSGGAQPQRRDPLVLDHLRVQIADLVSAPSILANLLLQRSMLSASATRQRTFAIVEQSLSGAVLTCSLLERVLKTLEVNRALTANRAHKGFATSSELADLLAIDCGLTRTEAYHLAERIATEASVLALGGMTLDTKLVDRMALEVIGREVGIEPETLGKCLSVKRFIERREVPGGPAPASVREFIEQEHLDRRQSEDRQADLMAAIESAQATLDAEVDSLITKAAMID